MDGDTPARFIERGIGIHSSTFGFLKHLRAFSVRQPINNPLLRATPIEARALRSARPPRGVRGGRGCGGVRDGLIFSVPTAQTRWGKGAASPQQGGRRGRGLQAPAHERARVPAGTGSPRGASRMPAGTAPAKGRGAKGAGRQSEPQRGKATRRGGGAGAGRAPAGEPRADAQPPRP